MVLVKKILKDSTQEDEDRNLLVEIKKLLHLYKKIRFKFGFEEYKKIRFKFGFEEYKTLFYISIMLVIIILIRLFQS